MTVDHDLAARRFVARDGTEQVGFLSYREVGEVVEALTTYTAPEHRGRGVAGELLDDFVAWVRAEGRTVRSLCSYVTRELMADPQRARLLVS